MDEKQIAFLGDIISNLLGFTEILLQEEIPSAFGRRGAGILTLNNILISRYRDGVLKIYDDPVHRYTLFSEFDLTSKMLKTSKGLAKMLSEVPTSGPVHKLSERISRVVSSHHALLNILFPTIMQTYDEKIVHALETHGFHTTTEEAMTLRGVFRYVLSFPIACAWVDAVEQQPGKMPFEHFLEGMNQRADICAVPTVAFEELSKIASEFPTHRADDILSVIMTAMISTVVRKATPVIIDSCPYEEATLLECESPPLDVVEIVEESQEITPLHTVIEMEQVTVLQDSVFQ